MRVNDAAPLEVVNDLYVEACGELFAAYGLTAHLEAQEADRRDRNTAGYVSVVSATGERIRLLSIASIDADLLARTHLLGVEHSSQRVLQDWCRELNNQLVGRLKNKLLEVGCDVRTGLPALITGTDMVTVTQPDSETRRYFFASGHGCMTLALEVVLAPDFKLDQGKSPADAGVVMHAGAVLF